MWLLFIFLFMLMVFLCYYTLTINRITKELDREIDDVILMTLNKKL